MLKIKMHEFIIAFMKERQTTALFISEIKYAVLNVARKANLMLYEGFDNTLENVLEVVVNFPKVFKLSDEANSLQLINPNKLIVYVEKWPVPNEVIMAIREYLTESQDPMLICSVDMDQAEQNENFICKDTTYINWLWDMMDQHKKISTKDTSLAKNGKDVANITRIFNLYILLSRYYSKNLMSSYKSEVEEGYIFHYSRRDKKRYFGVGKFMQDGSTSYRIIECRCVKGAPYFPDAALGVPCASLDKKIKLLERAKKLFEDAANMDIRYEAVKGALDYAYGKQDNDDR